MPLEKEMELERICKVERWKLSRAYEDMSAVEAVAAVHVPVANLYH